MKSQHLLWLPALLLTKQEGALAPLLPQSSPQRFRDEKGMSGSHWSHAVERCDRQHSRSSLLKADRETLGLGPGMDVSATWLALTGMPPRAGQQPCAWAPSLRVDFCSDGPGFCLQMCSCGILFSLGLGVLL